MQMPAKNLFVSYLKRLISTFYIIKHINVKDTNKKYAFQNKIQTYGPMV